MTQAGRIIPSQHIQIESLLSLASLTPDQFEHLIHRLSNQGRLDDLIVMDENVDEQTFLTVTEALQSTVKA